MSEPEFVRLRKKLSKVRKELQSESYQNAREVAFLKERLDAFSKGLNVASLSLRGIGAAFSLEILGPKLLLKDGIHPLLEADRDLVNILAEMKATKGRIDNLEASTLSNSQGPLVVGNSSGALIFTGEGIEGVGEMKWLDSDEKSLLEIGPSSIRAKGPLTIENLSGPLEVKDEFKTLGEVRLSSLLNVSPSSGLVEAKGPFSAPSLSAPKLSGVGGSLLLEPLPGQTNGALSSSSLGVSVNGEIASSSGATKSVALLPSTPAGLSYPSIYGTPSGDLVFNSRQTAPSSIYFGRDNPKTKNIVFCGEGSSPSTVSEFVSLSSTGGSAVMSFSSCNLDASAGSLSIGSLSSSGRNYTFPPFSGSFLVAPPTLKIHPRHDLADATAFPLCNVSTFWTSVSLGDTLSGSPTYLASTIYSFGGGDFMFPIGGTYYDSVQCSAGTYRARVSGMVSTGLATSTRTIMFRLSFSKSGIVASDMMATKSDTITPLPPLEVIAEVEEGTIVKVEASLAAAIGTLASVGVYCQLIVERLA